MLSDEMRKDCADRATDWQKLAASAHKNACAAMRCCDTVQANKWQFHAYLCADVAQVFLTALVHSESTSEAFDMLSRC